MKKYIAAVVLTGLFYGTVLADSKVNFGSRTSAITLENGSTMRVNPTLMTINRGTINRKENALITGSPIRFNRGSFIYYNSQSDITGVLNTQGDGTFELGQNPDPVDTDIIVANPGGLYNSISMKPGANFLRGQPLFLGGSTVSLEDGSTLLAIAIQNTLNTNVALNGGYLFLQDDLRLGDDATLNGDGQVIFNNRRLSLGGKSSTWTGNIIWNSALDIQLNSFTRLEGSWSFYGDGQINGNGNVIDISNGGAIIIQENSTLRLSGVKIKGLGSGAIFMENGAQIRLSGTDIEMDDDYIINSGGFYIDGNSTIITKDKYLTFASSLDSHGSLTVDRVALTYDHQDYVDHFNIRPLRIQDPNHKYINIINNGAIRHFRQESITFLDYSADTVLQRYAIVTPQRPMKVYPEVNKDTLELNYNITVDGGTNFLGFTRSDDPIMFISDGVKATYRNVIFRDFSPKHLSLGQGSNLIFGDKTMITLARNEVLNVPWVFEGTTVLRGGGQILELGPQGELIVQGRNSSLLLDSVTLKGVSDSKIRCLHDSSKVIYKDVRLHQDSDYTFSTGGIDLLGNLSMTGPYTFNYTSSQPFTILSDATLEMTRYKVFHYQPVSGARDLLRMTDATATISLEDTTIEAPAPGLKIAGGWLRLSNRNFVTNIGGSTESDGVVVGGSGSESMVIQRQGNASLELASTTGFYVEKNS